MQRRRKQRPVPLNCNFCKEKKEVDFREIELINQSISDRGKIIGKDRSGICSKHQRQLTKNIKYARYIGLAPFVVRPG